MEGNPSLLAQIAPELELVQQRVARELRLPGMEYLNSIQREYSPFDNLLHPSLVILSAKLFSYHPRPVLALACVLQFIFLATRIHFSPSGRMGLPVLVGDLLYSKFFSYLCRYNCLEFLAPLADVICRMHEGRAMRHRAANWAYPDCLQVIDREVAFLMREACRAGARLGGAPAERVEYLGDYGFNLGRAWGLLKEKTASGAWREFLARAREKINSLPARPERDVLGALADAVAAMAVGAGRATTG